MVKKTTPHLPSELITEILLRLPVKSLIRYKSVCKSWLTLISNPNFANSHFHSSEAATQTRRILSISAIPPQIRSIDFQALLNNHSTSSNPNLSLPQFYFPLRIGGSCRGFIFLNCSSYYYIWNPSTGFCKKIVLSPFDYSFCSYLYGFGYDHSRDDYTVVSLSCDDNSSYLMIFSLRDNTWKQIEDRPFRYKRAYNCPKVGFFFNGAIHWFVTHRGSSVKVIVAFDLMERKLLEINIPTGFNNHYIEEFDLWVYGEFLSIWVMRNSIVEIWVMKEYKVGSSWAKTLVLPIGAIPYFSPIYSTKNGDIFGTIGGTGLVKYNGKGQLLGHCSYCDDPRGSQVVMYTESLLSLLY
ncbi:F-box/kelch-repeat protein [Trifolium repens]|nr:F-box/kelch-repeat protein [Trifolium repens]